MCAAARRGEKVNNIVAFPKAGLAPVRVVEELSFEEFCIADWNGEWISRTPLGNGMTILTYPDCVMICCDSAHCTLIKMAGANTDAYFEAALEALSA